MAQAILGFRTDIPRSEPLGALTVGRKKKEEILLQDVPVG